MRCMFPGVGILGAACLCACCLQGLYGGMFDEEPGPVEGDAQFTQGGYSRDAEKQSLNRAVPTPPTPTAVSPEQAALRSSWFEGKWTVKWEDQGTSADMDLINGPGEIVTWMGPADSKQYSM